MARVSHHACAMVLLISSVIVHVGHARQLRKGKPLDHRIHVVGRHRVVPEGVQFDYAGVTISATVTGVSTLHAVMSRSGTGRNQFVVWCDGQRVRSPESAASLTTEDWLENTTVKVELCSGLDRNMAHTVRFTKNTEAGQPGEQHVDTMAPQYVTFMGFDGALLHPEPYPERKIEFFGDSQTNGFCILGVTGETVIGGPNLGSEAESVIDAWPSLVCDKLQAQCNVVAWSGLGMSKNFEGGSVTMRHIWSRSVASVGSPESNWDFQSWVPDVVVVNLGTNDWKSNNYTDTYIDWLIGASDEYGAKTSFILACGPMVWPGLCHDVKWVVMEGQRRGVNVEFLDLTSSSIIFQDKYCTHPNVADNQDMAQKVLTSINAMLDWH